MVGCLSASIYREPNPDAGVCYYGILLPTMVGGSQVVGFQYSGDDAGSTCSTLASQGAVYTNFQVYE